MDTNLKLVKYCFAVIAVITLISYFAKPIQNPSTDQAGEIITSFASDVGMGSTTWVFMGPTRISLAPAKSEKSIDYQKSLFNTEMVKLTNNERKEAHKNPLTEVKDLDDIALSRAERVCFSAFDESAHAGFQGFFPQPNPYQWVGENISRNSDDPHAIVPAFMLSPTHKANLLAGGPYPETDYQYVGIGKTTCSQYGNPNTDLIVVELFAGYAK